MSYRSFLASAAILLLLFSAPVRSQKTAAESNTKDDATIASRQKAFDLLESVGGQLGTLRSAENRARIGSNVAELLWDHDEKRARSLFAGVEEDFKSALDSSEPDDEVSEPTRVLMQLRGDVISRIAKHDPDLALQFLRATRSALHANLPNEVRGDDRSQELRLAAQIVAKNPQLALRLGRDSLENGPSADLLPMLIQLQETDKAAGASLLKAIVERLQHANLAQDTFAREFAINLLRSFAPPLADELAYRELVGIMLTNALANGCAASERSSYGFCSDISSIIPKIEKYYPSRSAGLHRWASDGPNFEAQAVGWNQTDAVFAVLEKGTVDDILALKETKPELKARILEAAISKASESGDLVRARQIASEIPDENQRRQLTAQIDQEQMWRSVSEKGVAEIQQALGTLPDCGRNRSGLNCNEQRIAFLMLLAVRFEGANRKGALTLLDLAGQLLDSTKPGKTQIEGRAQLAVLYCSLKSDRGFSIIESLIPKLNELVAAASVLDGFENHYLRDDEWAMKGEGNIGRLLNHLSQSIGSFAWLDFDRSVTLANQLERPELRLMARAKIAQAILTGQGKPTTIVSYGRSFN